MSKAIIVIASSPAEINAALAKVIKGNFPQAEINQALAVLKAIVGDTPEYRKTAEAVTAKPKTDWAKYIKDRCEIIAKTPICPEGVRDVSKALAELAGEVPATQLQVVEIQGAYANHLQAIAHAVRASARSRIDDTLDGDISGAGNSVRKYWELVQSEYMENMAKVQADPVLTGILNKVEEDMDGKDARWVQAVFPTMAR